MRPTSRTPHLSIGTSPHSERGQPRTPAADPCCVHSVGTCESPHGPLRVRHSAGNSTDPSGRLAIDAKRRQRRTTPFATHTAAVTRSLNQLLHKWKTPLGRREASAPPRVVPQDVPRRGSTGGDHPLPPHPAGPLRTPPIPPLSPHEPPGQHSCFRPSVDRGPPVPLNGSATHFSFTVSSLKMCTVSVLLEADRNMPSMPKAREQMLTHLGREGQGRSRCCLDAEGRRRRPLRKGSHREGRFP